MDKTQELENRIEALIEERDRLKTNLLRENALVEKLTKQIEHLKNQLLACGKL